MNYNEIATQHYIVCALFADTPDESRTDPAWSVSNIAPESRDKVVETVNRWIDDNKELLAQLPETFGPDNVGHNLWLTRNGHGVGFWDRGLGDPGDQLSTEAEALGECDLYLGDDGRLWFS